ncbi:hypothetical protein NDU88_009954 [Pleurodeles waltl]|uniref:Uncharacterized protein n=1 Tax=Pleurodeles waltl TaxID=8319 RepID=A0AAV7RY38_PLEWA|nr:hypothetical protein NDU88_009954 [Pleurodeles waltl]
MASDAKVQEALRLLWEAGRLDMVREEALHAPHPVQRAVSGVVVAVLACSSARHVPSKELETWLGGQALEYTGKADSVPKLGRWRGPWGEGVLRFLE